MNILYLLLMPVVLFMCVLEICYVTKYIMAKIDNPFGFALYMTNFLVVVFGGILILGALATAAG